MWLSVFYLLLYRCLSLVISAFLGFSESGDPSCTIMQIWAKIEVLSINTKHHITRKENKTAHTITFHFLFYFVVNLLANINVILG